MPCLPLRWRAWSSAGALRHEARRKCELRLCNEAAKGSWCGLFARCTRTTRAARVRALAAAEGQGEAGLHEQARGRLPSRAVVQA